ncbi:multicopper oxidase domain-containing protein [Gloeobacter violaceus]
MWTFVHLYHCHILEHEDGGMMGTVEARLVGKVPPQK